MYRAEILVVSTVALVSSRDIVWQTTQKYTYERETDARTINLAGGIHKGMPAINIRDFVERREMRVYKDNWRCTGLPFRVLFRIFTLDEIKK